jgi:hypothetical protein
MDRLFPYCLAIVLLVVSGILIGCSADVIMSYDFGYLHLILFAVGIVGFILAAYLMWLLVSEPKHTVFHA